MKPNLTRDSISAPNFQRRIRLAEFLSFLAVFLVWSAGAYAAAREKPSMTLSVSPEKVWPGESALLRVQIKNADTDTPPDMDYLNSEFDVLYQGHEPISHSLQITINGKTTFSEDRGNVFFYRLTPKQAGTIQIEPPMVNSDGVPIEAEPVLLRVVQPPDQDLPAEERGARLELSVSPETIYPHTLFSVTISVYLKESSEEHNPPNPLNRTAGRVPLQLSFGWGLDDRFPPEISPNEDVGTWLAPLTSSRGGFSINGLCQRSVFSLFDDRETLLTFLPAGKLVEQTTPSGKSVRYWRYDFTRRLKAAEPGEYDLQNAVLKGNMGGKDLYAASAPLKVLVHDVPQPRPEGYLGAVASTEAFRTGARLSADTAEVGQALTLEVTLDGVSEDADLRVPDLETYEPLASRFRIYAPNRQQLTGAIRWQWNLRPIKPGDELFPAIPLAFFDSGKGEFKTFQTKEFPLTVKPGNADLASFADAEIPADTPEQEGGIYGNKPIGRFVRQYSLQEITMFAITLYAALLMMAGTKWMGQYAAKRSRSRSGLFRNGEKMLRNAFANRNSELLQTVTAAFFAPIAERLETPVDVATRCELDRILCEMKECDSAPMRSAVIEEVRQLLDRLEEEKYSGALSSISETETLDLYHRWERLFRTAGIEGKKGKRGQAGVNAGKILGLLLPLLLFPVGCRPSAETQEQFEQAGKLFSEAERSDGSNDEKMRLYRQAAALYEGLLQEGKENGAVLHNLGNAYYRAGDAPRALFAWRRAERYLPADKALKGNIAALKPVSAEKKRFLETVFFWRPFLSRTSQEAIFAFLTLLFFTFMAVRIYKRGRCGKNLTRAALTALILSFPIYAALFFDTRADASRAILIENADIRKGDSLQYEAVATLPPLAECCVLETRGGWLRVRTQSEQIGWVETDKVLTR